MGLHLLHNAGAKELAASHAGREKGLFLLISIGADMASAVSSLLFDPWNPSVSPPRVPSTSPSRKARQQMLQFHGKCTANPHVPLQPKAQEALYAAQQHGLFQQAVQIHGLILSSKKRKTFSWCVLQAEIKGLIFFIFYFAETITALTSALAASSVPWQCSRDTEIVATFKLHWIV